MKISWAYIQDMSDIILLEGLSLLKKSTTLSQIPIIKGYGNYLISHENKPFYIGEAKDLNARLTQQLNPRTSTFYKTYLTAFPNRTININDFKIQIIETSIGRKEMEEMGIVNLPTILNKFQTGKRNKIIMTHSVQQWSEIQNISNELLSQGENSIMDNPFKSWFDASPLKTAGLYLVKDANNKLIYIGESSDIKKRYETHCDTTYFSALRRHIGTVVFDYKLMERNGKKRYFTESEDVKITEYLRKCTASFNPVLFGRYELEEFLIRKYKPLLNRKENKFNETTTY